MKHKNIYNKNDISYSAGVLFGPIGISNQYELIKTNNSIYCIRSVNDEPQELSYFEVDENKLYTDILKYGNELYQILKDELIPVDISKVSSRNKINIIYENSIDKYIDKIEPICFSFLNNYGFPVAVDELISTFDFYMYLNKNCYNIIPVIDVIRYILVIYMLHQSIIHLSDIKVKYPEIHNCFFKNIKDSNLDMLEALSKYANSRNLFMNNSSKYLVKVLTNDSDNLIPIRYTTNLFTFAFETFVNCMCTLSFKEWEANDTYSYISFRKCQKCLKNIYDEPNVSTTSNHIPLNKFYICDDCKRDAKIIASRKYEHSVRELYDKVKAYLLTGSNPELISEIKSMPPKDKITKAYLKELEAKIAKENGRA